MSKKNKTKAQIISEINSVLEQLDETGCLYIVTDYTENLDNECTLYDCNEGHEIFSIDSDEGDSEICGLCDGRGSITGKRKKECPECGGIGKININAFTRSILIHQIPFTEGTLSIRVGELTSSGIDVSMNARDNDFNGMYGAEDFETIMTDEKVNKAKSMGWCMCAIMNRLSAIKMTEKMCFTHSSYKKINKIPIIYMNFDGKIIDYMIYDKKKSLKNNFKNMARCVRIEENPF